MRKEGEVMFDQVNVCRWRCRTLYTWTTWLPWWWGCWQGLQLPPHSQLQLDKKGGREGKGGRRGRGEEEEREGGGGGEGGKGERGGKGRRGRKEREGGERRRREWRERRRRGEGGEGRWRDEVTLVYSPIPQLARLLPIPQLALPSTVN